MDNEHRATTTCVLHSPNLLFPSARYCFQDLFFFACELLCVHALYNTTSMQVKTAQAKLWQPELSEFDHQQSDGRSRRLQLKLADRALCSNVEPERSFVHGSLFSLRHDPVLQALKLFSKLHKIPFAFEEKGLTQKAISHVGWSKNHNEKNTAPEHQTVLELLPEICRTYPSLSSIRI